MREFGFELSLCARLEADREAIVARQLGGGVADPGGRILDVVLVDPGPAFEERAAITAERIPMAAIESAVGTGRFRPVREAFDRLELRRDHVDAIVDRAVEIGFFERRRRSGRDELRQTARSPSSWFGDLVAIENKPDLGSPGALETQLRTDVSLGLVDRVVLATESYVTRAHLNRIPDAVGVWRFDPESGSIDEIREPNALSSDAPGVELLDRRPGRADIKIVDATEKARARRRLAERAYGKGWRTYDFPDCAAVSSTERHGSGGLPYCAWKGRLVDPGSECGEECSGYDPEPAPEVDLEAERSRRSPWVAEPEGRVRRQAGLDRFG